MIESARLPLLSLSIAASVLSFATATIVAACSSSSAPAATTNADASSVGDGCMASEDSCTAIDCSPDGGIDLSSSAVHAPPAAGTAPVDVVLTFDDTFADQYQIKSLLSDNGMHATFFINSARIDRPTYMTAQQIHDLESDGNEIAGHTVNHPSLPTVDPDEQARQVCDDRVALLNHGYQVQDFAYPHGAYSPVTEQIVQACGYNSARSVGGLSCQHCPGGESTVPQDVFAIRTPSSVKCNTSVTDMMTQVTDAENGVGGFVPIVMHHVCDDCGPNSVKYDELKSFLEWLAPRTLRGTSTKTMRDIIPGIVQPGVNGPPAPATPETAGNILRNPGLEEDVNNDDVPDCWVKGGEGVNTYSYGRTSDAHTGSWAEFLTVNTMTSGVRRILSTEDLGGCAPSIQPGHHFQLSAFYKSAESPLFSAFYRDAGGFWQYWSQSPTYGPCADYCQATWTIPKVAPDDAQAISVSLTLGSTGTITMDDFSLIDLDEQ